MADPPRFDGILRFLADLLNFSIPFQAQQTHTQLISFYRIKFSLPLSPRISENAFEIPSSSTVIVFSRDGNYKMQIETEYGNSMFWEYGSYILEYGN